MIQAVRSRSGVATSKLFGGTILAIGFMTMMAAGLTQAATILVPANQPTIQAGINAAGPGDTVLVSPGIYPEQINFNGKAITVAREQGPDVTAIEGNNAGPVVTFQFGESRAAVIRGFTIRNGVALYEGGGVKVANSSPSILNNVIRDNHGCDGLGIGVGFGSPLIQGNTITNNSRTN